MRKVGDKNADLPHLIPLFVIQTINLTILY